MQDSDVQADEKIRTALELLAREEKAYREHWLWRRIGCSPEQLFEGLRRHLAACELSPAESKQLRQTVEAEISIRHQDHLPPCALPLGRPGIKI